MIKRDLLLSLTGWAIIVFALSSSVCADATGPNLQTIYNFVGEIDGTAPTGNLVADAAGNLYGTTSAGGSKAFCQGSSQIGCGVVFKLSPPSIRGGAWKQTVLYRFTGGSDGAMPMAGLIFDQAGNLYGTAGLGGTFDGLCSTNGIDNGCGVIFELSPQENGTWMESVLYSFTGLADGYYPAGSLIFDGSGNLYGTAEFGGVCTGCGTVFEISPNGLQSWTETTLYQFPGDFHGAIPAAGLIFDQVGNLYGTTVGGGTGTGGTVFELSPAQQGQAWVEQVLYDFPGPLNQPKSALIFDAAGNLYGTATYPSGGVFELSPSLNGVWSETTLYTFGEHHSAYPSAGVVADSAGNLYGTTLGKFCGALYRLKKNQDDLWSEAELDFNGGNVLPCNPQASLTFGKWGALYGTTASSGSCKQTGGCGTVFAVLP